MTVRLDFSGAAATAARALRAAPAAAPGVALVADVGPEKLAKGSRVSQYRFERWVASGIGFEEFDVVLSVATPAARHAPSPAREHEAVSAEDGA